MNQQDTQAVARAHPSWRKSSYSKGQNDCVEISVAADDRVLVRDSKNPNGPVLAFPTSQWRAVIGAVKAMP